ncbi:MAG: M48 family metallopeptidase [Alphaproteobacteria bacterium]|nr:M48 family metallopeptidase [Alphaproteobacteria bacterium]
MRSVALALSFLGAFCVAVVPTTARAVSLIRDAEIENTIRVWATPLFEAAGLVPDDVHIVLVNDRTLNAFVAGGQNLFLNTGLLLRSQHAGQVIGVIAHETGHIAGGHLARLPEAMKNATAMAILSLLIGAVAGVAAGRPDAAVAGVAGGMTAAERNFLAYTRTQEASADQAGVNFMEQNGLSSRGLMEFFDILSGQELMVTSRQDPYVRTHPLTKERIDFVRNFVARSRYSDAPLPPEWVEMHKRMRAKLFGFIEPISRTLTIYKDDDKSVEARYARAVALYRKPDVPRALATIDSLLREAPNDPFFHELRGQTLFENGRAAEALPAYERAVELLPKSGLLRIDLARVQLEFNRPDMDGKAVANLNEALRQEGENSMAWRQLAIGEGRIGNIGMAALALAEEALLLGKYRIALGQAQRAERLLPVGSPPHMRVQDLQVQARRELAKQRDQGGGQLP